jgi:hypothetical protein
VSQHAILSDYNSASKTVKFELSGSRTPLYTHTAEMFFSYRSYKDSKVENHPFPQKESSQVGGFFFLELEKCYSLE